MNEKVLVWLALVAFFTACNKSPNDGIPSYIEISQVELNTNPNQGSDIHLISDLWIESEGEYIGNFEYPNVIPALIAGNREIIMNAGIFRNGDYNNREIYPAYQPFKANFEFIPGDTVLINPSFSYYNTVLFPLIEDFESGNIFTGTNRTALGDLNNIDGRALNIHLDGLTPSIETITSSPIVIPFGRRVYLEMQFKGNNDFGLGIQAIVNGSVSQQGYIDAFYSSSWYKIHYDITDVINSLDADGYNFYIEAIKSDSQTESDLYLDNFKIVVI